MELNLNAIEGLQLLGDTISVPDQGFQILHDCVQETILEANKNETANLDKVPGVDVSVAKQCFLALSTLIVEVSRKNVEESEISTVLEECKWSNDRQEVFLKTLKVNKKDLQMKLCRVDSSYPHVVDLNWRLDYCIKSNQLEKINESSYMVSLKTQEPGNEGNVEFFCSVDQLQDLVTKLKDATKAIEKASQS